MDLSEYLELWAHISRRTQSNPETSKNEVDVSKTVFWEDDPGPIWAIFQGPNSEWGESAGQGAFKGVVDIYSFNDTL